MSPLEMVVVALAGVFAGGINTVVGSGTLVAFPALLAVGYPPVVANVSNSLGLAPGSLSGAYGYRDELRGQHGRVRRLLPASLAGAVTGASLLLVLPADAFSAIVPVLILVALVLVAAQPFLVRRLASRPERRHEHGGLLLWTGVLLGGVYGGYFGAAQGVLLLGLMGVLVPEERLQRMNALKNLLVAMVNLTAGIVFVFVAHVAWTAVLLLGAGSVVGGQIGARVGRRLPPAALRAVIVVVGVAAVVKLNL
ncbi:sulfite exporter TauE/SafE family protein [Actinomadura graeca]|uniref:Probable membrane transporter protein n=1 Tax=Actinomadura graeca TaxID=2750812 RepID=A0ABX8QUP9_9ACTN|nr:sulfite exporter TauE/SafE family protein [Actinomadura graeca]QXJ22471.1 sulfite exporter TauE/SafE family protein [Actinomadura graeca]